MPAKKLSLSIPYKGRLDNIRLVFESLANQTMDRSEFEVIVGAMEYSEEYVSACREFTDRLAITSVLSSREFHIPHARNLAMRQATGRVVVQMDADTLLPPDGLRNLYDRHFAFGQNVCVVGQVVGYGNNNDGDVESVRPLPYEAHQSALDELVRDPGWPLDSRFQTDHVIPWAFGWTGLIALPLSTVRTHDLFFDEDFRGWGVDDLEWSYRICVSGTPIVLRPDVYALHLPHIRDTAANRTTETSNYRRFLNKWPGPDVELAHAFGDIEANSLFLDYQRELQRVAPGRELGTLRGTRDGRTAVVVGVARDRATGAVDPSMLELLDGDSTVEYLPLVGLALPHENHSIDECHISPVIAALGAQYRDAALAEAERVGKRVMRVAAPE